MVLANENPSADPHMSFPYWFGRVLAIGHIDARLRGSTDKFERFDFAWVRWLGINENAKGGWLKKRPPSVSYIPADQPGAFAVIDPAHIIRGVHIIPTFTSARTDLALPGNSIARRWYKRDDDCDWSHYWVNIVVDRDAIMRFRGGGVGHLLTRGFDLQLESKPHTHKAFNSIIRPNGAADDEEPDDELADEDWVVEEGDPDEEEGGPGDPDSDEGEREGAGDSEGSDDSVEGDSDDDEVEDEDMAANSNDLYAHAVGLGAY
ncbi:hypothetical protein BC834DRAFT_500762 [Gloeopeniophorella convolvens]|nr:hypothetical protein BC834DRAFT_500762 [Gloeopeniophorella convolvens]